MNSQMALTTSVPKKANECFIGERIALPQRLFGQYWLAGEMSLLFGPPGIGKSVLAVQIGDALARGRPIDRFAGPTRRHKVLYVDLAHSDAQFQTRYSRFAENGVFLRSFRFAERFYRGRPAADESLFDWLRTRVAEDRFEAVIIDDLSALRRTQDGSGEAAKLMEMLGRVRGELGISMLVLAVCDPPAWDRPVSDVYLRRSRVILGLADTAFALGPIPETSDKRHLIGIRNCGQANDRSGEIVPPWSIKQNSEGMLAFCFDKYDAPYVDPETRGLISRINKLRQNGTTFRQIAIELGISKSRAARLAGR